MKMKLQVPLCIMSSTSIPLLFLDLLIPFYASFLCVDFYLFLSLLFLSCFFFMPTTRPFDSIHLRAPSSFHDSCFTTPSRDRLRPRLKSSLYIFFLLLADIWSMLTSNTSSMLSSTIDSLPPFFI